jgi:hypothetical protein
MTAAHRIDRQLARLLLVNGGAGISHLPRIALGTLFRPGDLVVANDAATLPASLHGVHRSTGEPIEARLAGWLSFRDPLRFLAVVFGAGDYRTRTEDRLARRRFRPPTGSSLARSLPRSNACSTIPSSYNSVSMGHRQARCEA